MLQQQGLLPRLGVFIFNGVSYLVGCSALVLLISVFGGFVTTQNAPIFNGPVFDSLYLSLIWNVLWIIGFGYKHTFMASTQFRNMVVRFLPEAMNRGLYTLATGVYLFSLIYFWAPIRGELWSVDGIEYFVVMIGFAFGWGFLFLATFMIDHFELFGLKQAYCYFKQRKNPPLSFVKSGFYAYVRHPIMTGLLVGMWCIPEMSYNLLVLAIGFTLYVFVGVYFEERKLKRVLGDVYQDYCQQVGGLVPKISLSLRVRQHN